MVNLQIQLTDELASDLKTFAKKHFEDSDDNLATFRPIHVVQEEVNDFVAFDPFIANKPVFYCNGEYYDEAMDLIKAQYEGNNKVISYKQYCENNKDLNRCIDEIDYFDSYGLTGEKMSRIIHYRSVAFFFIRDNAKDYINKYSYKLNNPIIYSYSPGYEKNYDYNLFYDMLLKIGSEIIKTQ